MKKLICILTMALVVPVLSLAAEQVSNNDQVVIQVEQKSVLSYRAPR